MLSDELPNGTGIMTGDPVVTVVARARAPKTSFQTTISHSARTPREGDEDF